MNNTRETAPGVPAFLAKLWRLVEDPETNDLICWNKDGRSFFIQNQAQFARDLLPLNYKHNNMASFIRQLNMYGFHKITSIDNGGLKFDRDEMEFSHPCFKRGSSYLLEDIKRKIANTKTIDEKTTLKPETVYKVLTDVKAMRGRQDSMDSRFSSLKHENESLWREVATVRQKVVKQQQIINKLVQFLITIVQPSRNMTSVKRHVQLMINNTPEEAKIRQTSESESSECGPVIHELREELFDEVNNNDSDLDDPPSPYVNISSVESNSPDNERLPSTVGSFAEDNNHLTTTMVNDHNQMITSNNQKNKRKNASSTITSYSSSPASKMFRSAKENVHIKTEPNDIDTLSFLDDDYATTGTTEVVPSSSNMHLTPTQPQSPYLSLQPFQTEESQPPTGTTTNDSVLYSTGDFIVSDIPSELFDESKIITDTYLVNTANEKYELKQKPSSSNRQLQLQSLGKVYDYGSGSSSPKNSNLQLAKVTNTNKCIAEPSRDVTSSSNIDGAQDDLDTLKDLLRGDGYSLDANTLLGLFNDSDILSPYGLLMAQENLQDRKGSELMTYQQPMYDLSDIMDINEENNENNSNSSKQIAETDSNLNTPYHE